MASRILLIMPKFYGLEEKTKIALENLGYEVEWIENKELVFDYHGTKSKLKILRRIYFLIFAPHVRYLKEQLHRIEDSKFDILLSINGHIICPFLFKFLKKNNPFLHSVLYLWDSSSMYTWKKESLLFDKVYTFDREDSENLGIEYRPNFFIYEYTEMAEGNRHDIFFAGKFSSERLRILDKITNLITVHGLNSYIKVLVGNKNMIHNKLIYNFLKMTGIRSSWINNYIISFEVVEGITKRDYFIEEEIRYNELQNELSDSNVILDILYSDQSGYSHRIIEALARGKKLITTNCYIKNESFYNPDQIRIIDKENPIIDCVWIKKRENFKINSYITDLELTTWLKSLINIEAA
jgi:hypothetical protein